MSPLLELANHVVRRLGARLSPTQLRGPWTYVGTPSEITGVVIDADPGAHSPRYVIRLADIRAPIYSAYDP